MGKIITMTESSRRLGVTAQTIKNWIAKGAVNAKKVGNSIYLDEDTIYALQDTVEEIEEQKKKLERLKELQREETEDCLSRIRDEEERRRYYKLCVEKMVRTDFFSVVLDMMEVCGILTVRESYMLKDRLYGVPLVEIGEKYGVTRERVRQITEKAIARSRDLTLFKERIEHVKQLESECSSLKNVIKAYIEKIKAYETQPELRHEDLMELKQKCELLSSKIVDCRLSVRVLNRIRYSDIETVADLVRTDRSKLIKFRNFGKKSLCELDDFVDYNGLEWGMDVDSVYQKYAELQVKYEQKPENNGKD